MRLQLTRKTNTGGIAGLEIEAGSIAVTEVQGTNGTAQVKASAIEPLSPGVFHEGEVIDPDGLAAALKSLFGSHKLSKRVRLGIGNQRVVVRTLRLPAIEDPKELEAAIRFQAQEQIPMPLDQAVLEHQVVGGVPAEEGSTPCSTWSWSLPAATWSPPSSSRSAGPGWSRSASTFPPSR